MADDNAGNQEQELSEAEIEAQTLAQKGGDAEGAGSGGGGALLSRRAVVITASLTLASFLVSGLIALAAGGHFQRRPLCALRSVPLVGRLIPAPPQPKDEQAADVPSAATLHRMPAKEIGELVSDLHEARESYEARQAKLGVRETRLRALQLDLVREREQLDKLMATLAERQVKLGAERTTLEADTVVVRSEERKRLTQLARIYEAQEPATAGKELAELDKTATSSLAVKVLATMTPKKAAPIFDAMEPGAAVALKTKLCKLQFKTDATKEGAP